MRNREKRVSEREREREVNEREREREIEIKTELLVAD